jgi:hypothetical protein
MYLDPVEPGVRRTPRPAATEQRDLVPSGREPTEDFVHVNLGAASLRVLAVLPVDEQNAH